MRIRIVDLVIVLALFATSPIADARPNSFAKSRPQNVASRSGWQTLDDCHFVANASNDGDSFHVTSKGKPYLFRLYFVDTAETDTSLGERIEEQAKYFGITPKQTVEVGKVAAQFTREKLMQPFTVRTCFQDALGRSKMERFYAIVQTPTGDLGEQLIENGLARIHGASANPTGLPRANIEWQKLQQLERDAKLEKVGGWGVNAGRMLVHSQKANNRAGVDPFDAFFHPERAAQTTGSTKPQDSFDAFFHRNRDGQGTTTEFGVRARSTSSSATATPAPAPSAVAAKIPNPRKLDVNTATEEQLTKVPGVGPVLAARIIAARPLKSADNLRQVKGIGDTRYEKLRPYFN
ncbi:MAG: competence protein ComEA [Verrucomicrobiota bacterium]|jgi:endonuclease YncB( thermonuclease family)/predicted flap endonuclease-1-like 5' DNA nuclease